MKRKPFRMTDKVHIARLYELLPTVVCSDIPSEGWEESKHPRGQPTNKGQFRKGTDWHRGRQGEWRSTKQGIKHFVPNDISRDEIDDLLGQLEMGVGHDQTPASDVPGFDVSTGEVTDQDAYMEALDKPGLIDRIMQDVNSQELPYDMTDMDSFLSQYGLNPGVHPRNSEEWEKLKAAYLEQLDLGDRSPEVKKYFKARYPFVEWDKIDKEFELSESAPMMHLAEPLPEEKEDKKPPFMQDKEESDQEQKTPFEQEMPDPNAEPLPEQAKPEPEPDPAAQHDPFDHLWQKYGLIKGKHPQNADEWSRLQQLYRRAITDAGGEDEIRQRFTKLYPFIRWNEVDQRYDI